MTPDPIGALRCPDCDDEFAFSQDGASSYIEHWSAMHAPAVATVPAGPSITGTARITKADGTTYEVPLTLESVN